MMKVFKGGTLISDIDIGDMLILLDDCSWGIEPECDVRITKNLQDYWILIEKDNWKFL